MPYKGFNSLKIENEKLKIIIVPELGGKIASVIKKNKDFEFYFQHKENEFMKPELYSNFAEFDASGFDDCFPSVDSGAVSVNGKIIRYPDHGEIWSKKMTYKIDGDFLKLCCSSGILPYNYEKSISLNGDTLLIDYSISNTGNESFPYIWTMHGLLNSEKDMEIFLPSGTKSVMNVQENKLFGRPGTLYSFPHALISNGMIYNLNKIESNYAESTVKFYVSDEITSGECGVYYPSNDVNCRIYFDQKKLPYLGLWITEGGFRGDYNLALEPSNGFYDSIDIAKKNGKLNRLNPGDEIKFSIKIKFSDGKYI